jgi:hypothetical protein
MFRYCQRTKESQAHHCLPQILPTRHPVRIWVIIRAEFIFSSEVQQSSQAVQKKPPPYHKKPKEKPHRLQSKFRNQQNRQTISTP